MAINFELLDTVHKFIDTHPEAHEQGHYARGELVVSPDQYDESTCGSTACIAGWSAVFGGWQQIGTSEFVEKDGFSIQMHAAGEQALGLNPAQAMHLFGGGNTRQGIDEMIVALHENPETSLFDEWSNDMRRRDRR